MDDLGLAAIVQEIHCNGDLLCDDNAGLPWNFNISAAVQQLEQVSALAIVDEQVVLILLLRYGYERHEVLVFLDTDERG